MRLCQYGEKHITGAILSNTHTDVINQQIEILNIWYNQGKEPSDYDLDMFWNHYKAILSVY